LAKENKLLEKLKRVPKDFTFDEMTTLLKQLGFRLNNKGKTSGSRVIFIFEDMLIPLHKPHPGNELKEYQLKDILSKLKEGGLIE